MNQDKNSKPKKKIPWTNIIILIILLTLIGIFIGIYSQDENQLGICKSADDCGRYNVFYMKGSGYVCANDEVISSKTFKSKILMFRYASNKAVDQAPESCSCIEAQCEVS